MELLENHLEQERIELKKQVGDTITSITGRRRYYYLLVQIQSHDNQTIILLLVGADTIT